jgi:hypothetical protein
MQKLFLNAGDIVLTRNPNWFGKIINFIEAMQSLDHRSRYGHSLIIVNGAGTTFEALAPRIRYRNFWECYVGTDVCVGRWNTLDHDRFTKGFQAVAKHEGQPYPTWRLFLHLLGLAKVVHWKIPVCSELCVKFLNYALRDDNMYEFDHWFGWQPDDLYHAMRAWKHFDIIFEGTLLEGMKIG